MAIASVPTKLPLATWARILGIHPLHFEGIEYTPTTRSPAVCDGGFMQYDWQAADQVSREQIAQAIAEAEAMIEQYLQFRLAPSWEVDEWQQVARPYQRELVNYNGLSIPIYKSSVPVRWKNVISGGVEGKTLIQASRPIAWSDADNDGLNDTGTVTATVAEGHAPCEVEIFYPGKAGLPRYQIRPATVVVSGTTATITFSRWQAVLEDRLNALDAEPADPANDAHFLGTVDVYRHFNDPSQQATLLWEPTSGCPVCGGDGCGACSYSVQTGCLFLRSTPRVGMVGWSPGTWDSTEEHFDFESLALGRSPDLVRLYYYAGYQSPVGCSLDMDSKWARAVTYLSLTFLDRPACQCTSDVWDYWREVSDSGKTAAAAKMSDNPFGPMRGAMYAWDRVNDVGVAVARFATV